MAFQTKADGIVSSDIVGYTVKDQAEGAYSKVACFDGIAVENMDIQSIVPTVPEGEGEELYSGAFQIMTLTAGTATDATYLYLTAEDAEGVDGDATAGWFNMDMDTRMSGDDAVWFAPGEGFLVISDFDGATVTFAGKVAHGDTVIELGAGANFCGNNALASLDIQNIAVGTECSAEGEISTPVDDLYSGAFQIMTLTPGTATDATYLYLTAEDAEGVDGDATAGWFNMDMDTRMSGDAAVSFASGEGFLIISDFDEAYAKIPGNPAL